MRFAADCSRCVGLCCVASAFAKGGDFALNKAAGQPCPNLGLDHRCGVHGALRERGFPGCVAFDCFGAGQHITETLFAGESWRDDPGRAERMFAAFERLRPVFGLRWQVEEALQRRPEGFVEALEQLAVALEDISAREEKEGGDLRICRHAGFLLDRVSESLRAPAGEDLGGAFLIEAPFQGRDLRRATLAGAILLGADLRGADLRGADLRGADLRVARLQGADLRGALFLSDMQLKAALGDARTKLPEGRAKPAHWS